MDTKKKGIGIFISVILAISVLAAMCAPASAAEKIDLFFLVDGSGSISYSDFQLQKKGLAYAINDSTVVPQDGSVSVFVIQFGTNVYLEVNLTKITNQTVADQVSSDIMNISQDSGMTNMGGAFNMATANFPSDPTGRQVIDLSTDGVPTAGPDTMTARNAALAAGFDVVNTFGVGVGIDEAFLKSLVYPQPWTSAPGFYTYADSFEDFEDKIKEKIRKEIEPPTPSAVPALTPIGLIALVGLLSVIAAISIRIRKRRG